jgi:hypothetical protein
VDIAAQSKEQPDDNNRRSGVERRFASRRSATGSVTYAGVERRSRDRRVRQRRVEDLPRLLCPDCVEPLQYEAALSWALPGTYTVDAGYCPSCARRFLRDRETGLYDGMSW